MANIHDVIKAIKESDGFLIAAHISPDGDALGSAIALGMALGKIDKRFYIYDRDGLPKMYDYLPGGGTVKSALPENRADYPVLILLDCNNLSRAALENERFNRSIVIDHHETESDFGDMRWIDMDAPATGLMIFDLIKSLGVAIDKGIAVNLYTAIALDTGTFRYANTTSACLGAASELVNAGAEPGFISDRLYQTWSIGRFKLFSLFLASFELIDGVIGFTLLDAESFKTTGSTAEDTENFVNHPLLINEVAVSVFIRESVKEPGVWKVSLRSKGGLNVADIAAAFGGGGHQNAAGCFIKGGISEIKPAVLKAVGDAIKC